MTQPTAMLESRANLAADCAAPADSDGPPDYQICQLNGLESFRAFAADWNDLWRRSQHSPPTVLFEAIELWLRTFGDASALTVITVSSEDRLVAGLPLIRRTLAGCVTVHQLPVNCWSHSGDMLVDEAACSRPLMEALLDGVQRAGVGLLTLDDIPFESQSWQLFRSVLAERGHRQLLTRERQVGVIDTLGNWPAYEASWTSKFRSSVRRNVKRLPDAGAVEIECHRNPPPQQVVQLLEEAFAIENKSWKGASGTSVLQTPGMLEYMTQEASQMTRERMLDIWFLKLDGQTLAFAYNHLANGTCYCHKIGFDPDHASLAPGKVLLYHQLKQYHDDPDCQQLDTLGALCASKAKWVTRTYLVARLHVALGSVVSPALLTGFCWARSFVRRESQATVLRPGAAKYLESLS